MLYSLLYSYFTYLSSKLVYSLWKQKAKTIFLNIFFINAKLVMMHWICGQHYTFTVYVHCTYTHAYQNGIFRSLSWLKIYYDRVKMIFVPCVKFLVFYKIKFKAIYTKAVYLPWSAPMKYLHFYKTIQNQIFKTFAKFSSSESVYRSSKLSHSEYRYF